MSGKILEAEQLLKDALEESNKEEIDADFFSENIFYVSKMSFRNETK